MQRFLDWRLYPDVLSSNTYVQLVLGVLKFFRSNLKYSLSFASVLVDGMFRMRRSYNSCAVRMRCAEM